MSGARYGYSPALDGVRGGAMVLFMAYHFGATTLQGVWVGINVFFVLSGFLIVRILTTEHARHGSIDAIAFYRRRARRLLPALALVLGTLAAWGLLVAPEQIRHKLGGDIAATMAYVQNWRLLALDDQYFGDQGDPSPLRHAWTLSIEEQFYVVVPLLLLALLAIVRSRVARVAVLLGLAVVSAIWTARLGLHSASDLPRLYYGTDVRVQSILVGAALGVGLARTSRRRVVLPRGAVLAAGAVGLAATLWSFVAIDPYSGWMYNQGGMLLFSLAAAALVVACADPVGNVFTRVLGWRPLAYTGRLSYGLYLWHWPIHLWLGPDRVGGSVLLTGALGMALTFVVAAASWRYVEEPVVRGGLRALLPPRVAPTTVLAAGLAPALAIALGAGVLRTSPAPTGTTEAPVAGVPTVEIVPGQPVYRAGEPSRILLYGDSMAQRLGQGFPAQDYPDVTLTTIAKEGCDQLSDPLYLAEGVLEPNRADCVEMKRTWADEARAARPEVVVHPVSPLLAIRHEMSDGRVSWLDDDAYRREVMTMLDALRTQARDIGAERLVLVNNPCREWVSQSWLAVVERDPKVVAEWNDPVQLNALTQAWADRHDDVTVLDLYTPGCVDGRPATIGGHQLISDDVHYGAEATPSLWRWLLGQLSATA